MRRPCTLAVALLLSFAASAQPIREPDAGVRLLLDADGLNPGRPTVLVVYATPNGNTAEQTYGYKGDGLDWHFDIQHIGAQVRRWREVDPGHNIVLAIVQSPQQSWPAFRREHADAPTRIGAMVGGLAGRLGTPAVFLSGHSGGGAFLFAYLDGMEEIPADVRRIIFLDANYSYADTSHHGDKLLAWLGADAERRLIVLAYDDREITLDGKKVLGPTGGTWPASGRMMERFGKELEFTETRGEPFIEHSTLEGRIRFYLHPNPENKILHTAMIGEMNGFLQAVTVGTPQEKAWGTFGGPRAYMQWVTGMPATKPATQPTTAKGQARRGSFPARAAAAIGGKALVEQIKSMEQPQREEAIVAQVLAGNEPEFLRDFKAIHVLAKGKDDNEHRAEYWVSPDYLSVGADGDFLRTPLTPRNARRAAEGVGCLLPTRKMVDDIYSAAAVKVEPKPMTNDRESVTTFLEHHQIIEGQITDHSQLVAGIMKDVVLTNRLSEKPGHVAIYGWHKLDGKPIQPLTTVHVERYVDYSHGIRLVARQMVVDGKVMEMADVLRDVNLCGLLSDEGVMEVAGMYR